MLNILPYAFMRANGYVIHDYIMIFHIWMFVHFIESLKKLMEWPVTVTETLSLSLSFKGKNKRERERERERERGDSG